MAGGGCDEGIEIDEPPGADFVRRRRRISFVRTHEHVIQFVLDQSGQNGRSIEEREGFLQTHRTHPHFFLETAARGVFGSLSRTRVRASGVGPESSRVVFVRGSLLNQETPGAVEGKDGDGTVERTGPVRFVLVGPADFAVVDVDQQHVRHGIAIGARGRGA